MKKFSILIYISIALSIVACKTVQKVPDKSKTPPVATSLPPDNPVNVVKQEPIALSIGTTDLKTIDLKEEVERLIVNDSLTPQKALDEIILTKRMVEDAKRRGYEKNDDFEGEFQTYRSIEAEKFLTDSTTIKHLLKETYQWMKEEVQVAHIMLQLPEFADPKDTLAAYQKLIDIRNYINAGEDFGTLAKQFSQDIKTNQKNGDLGWFTAPKMFYPLEKAAYTTQKGQISMPFRTKTGIHILKVINRRPFSGKLIVQHIAKKVPLKATESENQQVKNKIDSIYNRLKEGDDFGDLSRKYSDLDKKNFAGIDKIFIGQWEDSFEQIAFALKQGELSQPFRTSGGWHILKLIEKEPLESYQEALPKLKNKVTTDSRGDLVKENALKSLKKQLIFVENEEVVKIAIAACDSNIYRKKWNYAINDEAANRTIFSLWKKDFKGKDFYEFVIERQTYDRFPVGYSPSMLMRSFYKKFVETNIKTYAEEHLEEINKDFKLLMNEYKSSILTMQLLNNLVYEKSLDTTSQRIFFEKNREKYKMPERIFATVITANDSKNIAKAKDIFIKGTPYKLNRLYVKKISYNKFLSDLTAEHKQILTGLLQVMRQNKDYVVEIGGHADIGEGDNASAERIEKVKQFLTQNGLPIERIIENDYVKTVKLDNFDWTKNQRVEFQFFSNAKKDIEKIFNKEKDPEAVTIKDGYFRKGDNKFVDGVKWQIGNHSIEKDGKFVEVIIEKTEPQRLKTIREARGEVINDYQKMLEKQFYEELEKKYPIKINEEEVQKALKPLSPK